MINKQTVVYLVYCKDELHKKRKGAEQFITSFRNIYHQYICSVIFRILLDIFYECPSPTDHERKTHFKAFLVSVYSLPFYK